MIASASDDTTVRIWGPAASIGSLADSGMNQHVYVELIGL